MFHRRIRTSSCNIIIALTLGLYASMLTGCKPQGADYDIELTRKEDGLVYRKADDMPYTGKAYQTVCGNDCSCLFLRLMIHWQGEFKNGKEHGTFIYPQSRKRDEFFCSGDKDVTEVKYSDGVEQTR